jgi:NACalpha-BTF3-like transcription factor
MEMGFPEAEAREALEKHGGDENAAVNSLLGM